MAQVLLHPQLGNCEVPHSPYACPSTDADSRAAINMEGEIQLKTQVEGKGLHPKSLGCPLDDSSKLGLAGRQGHVLLRGRPVLDHVGAPEQQAS